MIPLRDANPTRSRPVVTLAIVILCAIVFAIELTVQATGGDAALDAFYRAHGLVPAELWAALGRGDLVGAGTAVVSSLFLHAGWLHLGGNLLYLWIFGNNVEDRFGRLPFLVFYLAGGLVAALTQAAVAPDSTVPVIGASGAIAAALGAYLVLYPRARVLSIVFLVFVFQIAEVPAVLVLGLWFVLQLVDGLLSLGVASTNDGGVAIFAHIGGFVAGALVGASARRLAPIRGASVG